MKNVISSSSPKLSKVSIIVPSIYNPKITQVCIDSIIKYTTAPYELILVQEGDDKELKELLLSYKDAKYVQNNPARGFAPAMNAGLKMATGDYICFLNNDTVFTPQIMEEILKAFESDKEIGLVSPIFTEMEPQKIMDMNKDVHYVEDATSMKGVCFVVRREVIDAIGGWDERFGYAEDGSGIGSGGDDNDFCYRVAKAGWKLAYAKNAYLYHYGSMSYRVKYDHDSKKSEPLARKNFLKFLEKHGLNKDERPSIYISVPTFTGDINCELATLLIQWSHDPMFKVTVRFIKWLSPLDNARNTAVKEFLEGYDDFFLHIDDDIVPPINALRELYKADKDVITPLCFTMRQGDGGLWAPTIVSHKYAPDGRYSPYFGEGVEEVDYITGGCHLVKRHVFEKLDRPYYFTYHANGEAEYSEDAVFSQQCQKLGLKLFTHYGLPCKHYKTIDVKNLNDLLKNLEMKKIIG
jgi:GT2 family glycosyltransferase